MEATKPDAHLTFSDDIDNTLSPPYVSAPSSPGHEPPPYSYTGGFFYSAPASPIHHHMTSSSISPTPLEDAGGSFEFELTAEQTPSESMTSADELFLNGQIRPMKLSSHLQRPQDLTPLVNIIEIIENDVVFDGVEEIEDRTVGRGRYFQSRDRRRKARSMSPLRSNTAFQWLEEFMNGKEESTKIKENEIEKEKEKENETASSGASSRSSSVGRNSKRWVFIKDLLYRSKSEGRNSSTNSNKNHKFWSTLSFSSPSGKKPSDLLTLKTVGGADDTCTVVEEAEGVPVKSAGKKAVNGVGINRKRRVGRSASAHEVHYTRNRAQAEEMRKKTYLPYRQGLLGCLGFSSKSYGAMNGFARALNPVSSR